MTPHLIFEWGLALAMSAIAVTAIAYAVDAIDGLVDSMRGRRTDVDPALARPIPEHVRQAIAEREGGNG